MSSFLPRLLLALSIPLILLSCSNGAMETIRKVTYPPDFNYISKSKIQDTMHQFAWYSTLLDNSLKGVDSVSEDQRENAISILRKMEKLSYNLGSEDLSSNHNVVSFNIDNFRRRIIDARVALQQTPPNYYLAGTVSGYCLSCHSQGKISKH